MNGSKVASAAHGVTEASPGHVVRARLRQLRTALSSSRLGPGLVAAAMLLGIVGSLAAASSDASTTSSLAASTPQGIPNVVECALLVGLGVLGFAARGRR